MSTPEEKAKELIAKADKKLTSWFASLSGSKFEDAEELYTKAANQLKVVKACARADGALNLPALRLRGFFSDGVIFFSHEFSQGTRPAPPLRRPRNAT